MSMLSPLLFVILLEAMSYKFRTHCPWKLSFADHLAVLSDTLDGLLLKLHLCMSELGSKGLRVNMGKHEAIISGPQLGTLRESGKTLCNVCWKGVSSYSILCNGYSHWVLNRCSNMCEKLTSDTTYVYRCKWYVTTACHPPFH